MLRWFASADQFQLAEAGSELYQFSQKPGICLKAGIFGETCMMSDPMAFVVQAPAL